MCPNFSEREVGENNNITGGWVDIVDLKDLTKGKTFDVEVSPKDLNDTSTSSKLVDLNPTNDSQSIKNPEAIGRAVSKYFIHLSFLVAVSGYVIINSFGSPMNLKSYLGYIIFLALLIFYFEIKNQNRKEYVESTEKKDFYPFLLLCIILFLIVVPLTFVLVLKILSIFTPGEALKLFDIEIMML